VNYSMFLSLLGLFPTRKLLVLDEAHDLPSQVLAFQSFSISRFKCQKYLGITFEMPNLGYEDLHGWIDFLIDLKKQILERMKINNDIASKIAELERKIVLFQFERQPSLVIEIYKEELKVLNQQVEISPAFEHLTVETREDINILKANIAKISEEPLNWIVSDIKFDAFYKSRPIVKIVFKPLDVSRKCRQILNKGDKVILMSATILDAVAYCRDIGLDFGDVKVIKIGSAFPIKNRMIYPLNITYLNHNSLQRPEVKMTIASNMDKIMTHHKEYKGIIHTTSYEQLNFIKENLSQYNKQRLLQTNPEIDLDDVITNHIDSKNPTVLIGPSMYLGLDLKDDLSRFQVITKVPFPNLNDKWIAAKHNRPEGKAWYQWQTALHMVQSYGRSVRSENDRAITYVLDSSFQSFVTKNRHILPNWFYEAIKS
jgi:ATP-dependent DNA helicase DinG